MSTVLIVPGWRNSGPGHWQSLWAAQRPGAQRVEQDDWRWPRRERLWRLTQPSRRLHASAT